MNERLELINASRLFPNNILHSRLRRHELNVDINALLPTNQLHFLVAIGVICIRRRVQKFNDEWQQGLSFKLHDLYDEMEANVITKSILYNDFIRVEEILKEIMGNNTLQSNPNRFLQAKLSLGTLYYFRGEYEKSIKLLKKVYVDSHAGFKYLAKNAAYLLSALKDKSEDWYNLSHELNIDATPQKLKQIRYDDFIKYVYNSKFYPEKHTNNSVKDNIIDAIILYISYGLLYQIPPLVLTLLKVLAIEWHFDGSEKLRQNIASLILINIQFENNIDDIISVIVNEFDNPHLFFNDVWEIFKKKNSSVAMVYFDKVFEFLDSEQILVLERILKETLYAGKFSHADLRQLFNLWLKTCKHTNEIDEVLFFKCIEFDEFMPIESKYYEFIETYKFSREIAETFKQKYLKEIENKRDMIYEKYQYINKFLMLGGKVDDLKDILSPLDIWLYDGIVDINTVLSDFKKYTETVCKNSWSSSDVIRNDFGRYTYKLLKSCELPEDIKFASELVIALMNKLMLNSLDMSMQANILKSLLELLDSDISENTKQYLNQSIIEYINNLPKELEQIYIRKDVNFSISDFLKETITCIINNTKISDDKFYYFLFDKNSISLLGYEGFYYAYGLLTDTQKEVLHHFLYNVIYNDRSANNKRNAADLLNGIEERKNSDIKKALDLTKCSVHIKRILNSNRQHTTEDNSNE
jgi:hypothetical protein